MKPKARYFAFLVLEITAAKSRKQTEKAVFTASSSANCSLSAALCRTWEVFLGLAPSQLLWVLFADVSSNIKCITALGSINNASLNLGHTSLEYRVPFRPLLSGCGENLTILLRWIVEKRQRGSSFRRSPHRTEEA